VLTIVIACFCGFAIFWVLKTTTHLKSENQEGPMMTVSVSVLSFVLGTWLICSALIIGLNSYLHYSHLIMLRGDSAAWEKTFSNGTTFEDGWKPSKHSMIWISALSVVLAFFLYYITYTTFVIIWNKSKLTRVLLHASLIMTLFFSFLALYYCVMAENYLS
jgi:hypothetical protein